MIIVNGKGCDLLRECPQSLHSQKLLAPEAWKVIVVGNDSGDGSTEMVRAEFPDARFIASHENLGFARANYHAYRFCCGRYVLPLNPDPVVLDHAANRMLEIM